MKHAWPLSLCLLTFAATPWCQATKLRPQHPRLLATRETFLALPKRIRTIPAVAERYEFLNRWAHIGFTISRDPALETGQLKALALAVNLENRPTDLLNKLEALISFMDIARVDQDSAPSVLEALAVAYDWCHDALPLNYRRAMAARMIALVRIIRSSYRPSDYDSLLYSRYTSILYAGIALYGEGVNDQLAASCVAQGEDLLKGHYLPTINQVGGDTDGGWPEGMAFHAACMWQFVQALEAWRTATGEDLFPLATALQGDASWVLYCTRPFDASYCAIGDIVTPEPWNWELGYYMPLTAQAYGDPVAQALAEVTAAKDPAHSWPFILWYDPSVQSVDLGRLPLQRRFKGLGWVAMRSAWKPTATFAIFHCGPYYCGHEHYDQNSFVIHKYAPLAIDAGGYGCPDTDYHNTLLIGGPQRSFEGDPARFYAPLMPNDIRNTGNLTDYEVGDDYVYSCGQAAPAYPPGLVNSFTRQFLYLRPDTFLVCDRVSTPAPQPVTFLLQSLDKSKITGNDIVITQGPGRLFCRRLWPEGAPSVEQIQHNAGPVNHRQDWFTSESYLPATSRVLLHLLQVAPSTTESMTARARISGSEANMTVTVTVGSRTWTVFLGGGESPTLQVVSAPPAP